MRRADWPVYSEFNASSIQETQTVTPAISGSSGWQATSALSGISILVFIDKLTHSALKFENDSAFY